MGSRRRTTTSGIRRIAAATHDDAVIIILEPDAIGLLKKDNCLSADEQTERLALIKDAVWVLRKNPKAVVYIDSGHAHWETAQVFAERLKPAGIEDANGFALNTSNYVTTEEKHGLRQEDLSVGRRSALRDRYQPQRRRLGR